MAPKWLASFLPTPTETAATNLPSPTVLEITALGPIAMGLARDLMGTYTTFFNLSAFLPLALAVVCLLVRPPIAQQPPVG